MCAQMTASVRNDPDETCSPKYRGNAARPHPAQAPGPAPRPPAYTSPSKLCAHPPPLFPAGPLCCSPPLPLEATNNISLNRCPPSRPPRPSGTSYSRRPPPATRGSSDPKLFRRRSFGSETFPPKSFGSRGVPRETPWIPCSCCRVCFRTLFLVRSGVPAAPSYRAGVLNPEICTRPAGKQIQHVHLQGGGGQLTPECFFLLAHAGFPETTVSSLPVACCVLLNVAVSVPPGVATMGGGEWGGAFGNGVGRPMWESSCVRCRLGCLACNGP